MKELLKKLIRPLIVYRVNPAGKYANIPRPDWHLTILVYVTVAICITALVLFVHPGLDTTGWYGTHQTP